MTVMHVEIISRQSGFNLVNLYVVDKPDLLNNKMNSYNDVKASGNKSSHKGNGKIINVIILMCFEEWNGMYK